MTKLLEKAFAEAAKLSDSEQEALANWILEELASERRWEETFAASADALAHLADEAVTDHQTGQTQELDPNAL